MATLIILCKSTKNLLINTFQVKVLIMRDSSGKNSSVLILLDDETRHIASGKGFEGDFESEVSRTANICTEEHKLHIEALRFVEVAHRTEGLNPTKDVDAAAIDRKLVDLTKGDLIE